MKPSRARVVDRKGSQQAVEPIKFVAVGNPTVGKTCMLMAYAKDEFPNDYIPTVFDNYTVEIPVKDKTCVLTLLDTAGQEDYDRLRPLMYSGAGLFLVCFSVVLPDSLESVREQWVPEILRTCPGAPFLLIGTKIDLRTDPKTVADLTKHGKMPISADQGDKFAKKIKAIGYAECSAKTRVGIKEAFQKALMVVLPDMQSGKKACVIC